MRTDPRIRQTWNQFSQNIESANESAQVNLFSFSRRYLTPCFSSIGGCFHSCTAPCFQNREERLRRNHGRTRGRAEYSFDFYDDWENDDSTAADGLIGLGNDELDGLLPGSSAHSHADAQQPGRQRAMSYGARRDRDGRLLGSRQKIAGPPYAGGQDSTMVPNSSLLGFFGRLPWKMGGKGLKYKPSAADLQDRSTNVTSQGDHLEAEPLMEADENVEETSKNGQARPRRDTAGSGSASDSIRSRADLFPSEDEDDAVPLDDEFAMVLERRTTGSGADDQSSRKVRGKTSSDSRMSWKTQPSEEPRKLEKHEGRTASSIDTPSEIVETDDPPVPSLVDLKEEEDAIRREEEEDIDKKRAAASRLAARQGLSAERDSTHSASAQAIPVVASPMERTTSSRSTDLPSAGTPLEESHQESQPQENHKGSLSPGYSHNPPGTLSIDEIPKGDHPHDS